MMSGADGRAFRQLLRMSSRLDGDMIRVDTDSAAQHPELAKVVQDLSSNRLLTVEKDEGRSFVPTQMESPSDVLVDESIDAGRASIKHAAAFLKACVVAVWYLRRRSIQDTVCRVRLRKELCGPSEIGDLDRARELTSAFNRLRGLFPTDYLCLFDSLALIEFLASFRIFPTWVFAVRFEPWTAHCWVQHRHIVFNEQVEEAEDYTPIMTV